MKEKLILTNSNNQKVECDILIKFEFDGDNYIVYTDNTYDKNGYFNLYKAMVGKDNKLYDPTDIDVLPVFDKLIADYKSKIVKGEI